MPNIKVSSRQVSEAGGISRPQLDQWISRGLFVPRDQPENGKARRYDFDEAIDLCAMAEMTRMGLPREAARDAVAFLRSVKALSAIAHQKQHPGSIDAEEDGYTAKDVILVVWQGTVMIPTMAGPRAFYDPDHVMFQNNIITPEQLPHFIQDRNKRSIVAVNLTAVVERLMAVLNKDEPA